MVLKVFSLYDSKAEAYMQPFFMQGKGQAIRALSDLVADEKSQVSRHPEDFTLFEIGEYDDVRGTFTNCTTPKSLGVAIEYKKHGASVTSLT